MKYKHTTGAGVVPMTDEEIQHHHWLRTRLLLVGDNVIEADGLDSTEVHVISEELQVRVQVDQVIHIITPQVDNVIRVTADQVGSFEVTLENGRSLEIVAIEPGV